MTTPTIEQTYADLGIARERDDRDQVLESLRIQAKIHKPPIRFKQTLPWFSIHRPRAIKAENKEVRLSRTLLPSEELQNIPAGGREVAPSSYSLVALCQSVVKIC